jgi:hypothetical protein
LFSEICGEKSLSLICHSLVKKNLRRHYVNIQYLTEDIANAVWNHHTQLERSFKVGPQIGKTEVILSFEDDSKFVIRVSELDLDPLAEGV